MRWGHTNYKSRKCLGDVKGQKNQRTWMVAYFLLPTRPYSRGTSPTVILAPKPSVSGPQLLATQVGQARPSYSILSVKLLVTLGCPDLAL